MIKVGPAGTSREIIEGLQYVKDQGLSACEIPFTHGIWMNEKKAAEVRDLNKELKLSLSIHAPYFINLCSKEKEKTAASKMRILRSMEIGEIFGATNVVFHAGFYMGRDKDAVYSCIKEQIADIMKTRKDNGWNVQASPEITGKATQFGDLDELLRLGKETGCGICVDFSHLIARHNADAKLSGFPAVSARLGKEKLGHIHAHFSGIEYGDKGEKRHIPLEDASIRQLLEQIKKNRLDITIICEAPDTIGDAVRIKEMLERM